MILPIGRYAGSTAGGAHEVQRAGVTERLAPDAFATWGLAHGPIDPVLAAGVTWTRAELVRYAEAAGVPAVADRAAELRERGLLAEVDPGQAAEFARTHRAVPLAVGLGNSAERPDQYAVGWFDQPLLQVDEVRYEVWCWSAAYESLWQVCEARATGAMAVTEVLRHFLTGLHQLASANLLYLDPVT